MAAYPHICKCFLVPYFAQGRTKHVRQVSAEGC